ncbi:unnamed protein product [Dimorphilus gyrociliatus]|uniref:G-protein coupled receptors family 2 profile 2 domain-containing protein n=1 Tax=Dimorphilus gyrociliatus TaxID=2664684 RepID=A0A7I8VUE2_9ANNE|nr:unnamed protein product [Dimorphilus gyrociliatus]
MIETGLNDIESSLEQLNYLGYVEDYRNKCYNSYTNDFKLYCEGVCEISFYVPNWRKISNIITQNSHENGTYQSVIHIKTGVASNNLHQFNEVTCDDYVEYIDDPPFESNRTISIHNVSYACKEDVEIYEADNKVDNISKGNYIDVIGIICLSLSVFALLVRLIAPAYCAALRKRANWLQWNLALALFLWLTCLICSPLVSSWLWPCRLIALSGHLSLLATITWQSFIAIDMYLKFRDKTLIDSYKYSNMKLWKIFIAIWLAPCIPVTIALVLETLQLKGKGEAFYGLNNNRNICWIHGFAGKIILLLIPFFLLWSINSILLTATTFNLHYLLKNSPDHVKKSRKEIIIYTKLSILFGGSWILVLLSSYIRNDIVTLLNIFVNSCQGLWLALATMKIGHFRKEEGSSSSSERQVKLQCPTSRAM